MKSYTELQYLVDRKIAYFPELTALKHGFSWGKDAKNMSYIYADEKSVVFDAVENFLKDLAMSPQKSCVTIAPEHLDNIVFVDEKNYNSFEDLNVYPDVGKEISCDTIFTDLPNVPIMMKPADCLVTIVKAFTKDGRLIVGLIHTGTKSMIKKLGAKSIDYLVKDKNCSIEDISLWIVPGIKQENYFFDEKDFSGDDLAIWKTLFNKRENKIHINLLPELLDQFTDAGIKSENITFYDIDTYEAAKNEESFSHRYAKVNNTKEGRFLVAVEI